MNSSVDIADSDSARKVNFLLAAISLLGLVALLLTTLSQRELQARWQSHLDAAGGIPPASAGQVVVHTVALERPYHWRVHLRGAGYAPFLYACQGEFHPTAMKSKPEFRCLSKQYECEGYSNAPLFHIPGDAIVSFDVKLRPRSDGSWWLMFDSMGDLHGDLVLAEIDALNRDDFRIASLGQSTTLKAGEPLRLFEVVPNRAATVDAQWLKGICCYLVPRDLSQPASSDCP